MKAIYKNIKTGKYYANYSSSDTNMLKSAFLFDCKLNHINKTTTDEIYIIVPYNQELRNLKLKHLNIIR